MVKCIFDRKKCCFMIIIYRIKETSDKDQESLAENEPPSKVSEKFGPHNLKS